MFEALFVGTFRSGQSLFRARTGALSLHELLRVADFQTPVEVRIGAQLAKQKQTRFCGRADGRTGHSGAPSAARWLAGPLSEGRFTPKIEHQTEQVIETIEKRGQQQIAGHRRARSLQLIEKPGYQRRASNQKTQLMKMGSTERMFSHISPDTHSNSAPAAASVWMLHQYGCYTRRVRVCVFQRERTVTRMWATGRIAAHGLYTRVNYA